MIFERIYVLSLPESSRREYIRAHFREIGIDNYSFFDAFSKDSAETQDAYRNNQVSDFPPCFRCGRVTCRCKNNILIPQQVANFISYRQLWHTISELPGLTLIVEDDVKFHKPFDSVCDLVGNLIRTNCINVENDPLLIRMGWGLCADHDSQEQPELTKKIVMANPCHAINGKYASKLISAFKSYCTTSDIFVHRDVPLDSEAFTLYPPVASDLSWSTGEIESLIHPRRIRSDYLNANGQNDEAAAHQQLVLNHTIRKEYRPLLLSGHPRCGTGYAAAVCRGIGLDVGHEADGVDGVCSWMLAVNKKAPYSKDNIARSREGLSWTSLICVARNPIEAIPSIMVDNIYAPPSYEYRRTAILDRYDIDLNHLATNFQRALASYVYWYRIILDETSLVFRIEEGPGALADLLSSVGSPEFGGKILSKEMFSDPGKTNSSKRYKGVVRDKVYPDYSDWLSLPESLRDEFHATSHSLGYSIPHSILFSESTLPPNIEYSVSNAGSLEVSTSNLKSRFLSPSGWALSSVKRKPLDAAERILPWFTYSAIEFLHRSVRKTDRVFEYGAGYGTKWWALNASSVIAVEHDLHWIQEISDSIPDSAQLIHRPAVERLGVGRDQTSTEYFKRMRRTKWDYSPEKEIRRGLDDDHFVDYASEITRHDTLFDIIVIDGMCRRLCADYAVSRLKKDGMIILDNSNRRDYDAAFNILEESGFRQIPFWGLVPGADFYTCTSIFIKSLERLADSSHHPSILQLPEY